MLFAEERERRVVAGACEVCSTWIARVVRVSPVLDGHHFWRREGGRLVATPLFVALAVIETTDIVFALDSVPAVLAITRNPLIVYSSNVLAMFGLRSFTSGCLTRSTGYGTCGRASPSCSCLLARNDRQ
jgi:predicted tellurium resistance membrane protein TerC